MTTDPFESRYVCKECGQQFPVGENAKFCAHCGARVESVGRTEVIDTRSKPLVLLVDDSNVARHKMSGILRTLNCEILQAPGGQEALEALNTTVPDLVILDINMPQVDGLQVLQTIRNSESLSQLPVVMLTGEADVKVVARAISLKPDDYIRKDDPVAKIRDRLTEHLEKLRQ